MIRKHLAWVGIGLVVVLASCSSASKKSSEPAASPSPAAAAAAKGADKAKKADAKAGDAGSRLVVKCVQGKDSRAITVVPSDKGCEVHYEKFGNSEVVASSSMGTSHCDEVQSKMKTNLETAGFTCN